MSQFSTPEGYVPYRVFTYDSADVACVIRPEQFIAAAAQSHDCVFYNVEIRLKDNETLVLRFGGTSQSQAHRRAFLQHLTAFMEEDALRNAHNAVMRKGNKFNGG